MDFTLTKKDMLHLNRDFQQLFKKGKVYRHPALIMFANRRCPSGYRVSLKNHQGKRLGIITPGKLSKAVERNKLRRRLKEIFRLNRHFIRSGTDIMFLAQKRANLLGYHQLEKVVFNLWKKAKLLEEIS